MSLAELDKIEQQRADLNAKHEKELAEIEKRRAEIVAKERASVLPSMLENIARFGFTAKDLGFGFKTADPKDGNATVRAAKKTNEERIAEGHAAGKNVYVNAEGDKVYVENSRGKKPEWIDEAEKAGTLKSLLIKNPA